MSARTRCAAVVAVLFLAATPVFAQTFVFHMRGDQEVPPVPSTASGGCMGVLDQPGMQFSITCVHDVVGATVMHIHNAPAGSNGPIVFDLGDPASPVTATWTGMTAGDIAELLAGRLYINVHTAGRPAGEIRGQILPRTVDLVNFTANGAQAVPPSSSSATATCSADLNDPATSLAVSCTHTLAGAVSAHVHEAPFGTNGPIVFTFPSPASPLIANVPMTPQLVADFAATFLYLDIHGLAGTEDTPAEEIRGQIGTPPAPITTGTIQITKETSPPGATGFGFTENVTVTGSFVLNDGQTQTFSGVAPGTYTVTENDPVSTSHTLGDLDCDDADSTTDLVSRTATIRVDAGEVVTCRFRNFETEPADELFVFHLSGDQEAPPVATPASGGCMGRFDVSASELSIICTHNVDDPTVMHIHRGLPGFNGEIVFDLGDPASPVIATWSGMTPAEITDLFAGNYYVNIHTAGRPSGEIRGQIIERSVDTVSFPMDASQTVPPGTTPATGNCTANLDDNATALAVQCTHNLPSPDLAHVHDAPRGQNGPVIFTFPSAASPLNGNVPLTPRLVADFAASFLYVDVHGTAGGEEAEPDQIRGQIGAPPAVITTGTIRIVKGTTPAGASGFNFTDNVPGSGGAFALNDGGVRTFTNVPVGSYTIAEGAASGFALTDVSCSDTDSVGNASARTATVNLQAGETVTCTFHNLQTFTAPSLFVFHLSGDQEVPPISTPRRGGCMAQFDTTSSSLSIVCTHDLPDAAVMHIHRGAPGVNGPIVFDLGDPRSPVEAVWTGMTAADITDLNAGNLYVNIHTSGRPTGEIRGQILPRTVDNFVFPMTGDQEVPPSGSSAIGRCSADLSANATSVLVQCSHNTANVTGIHLHSAPPGQEGPIIFHFPATNPFTGDAPLSPRYVADFAAGFLYVNVHTVDLPDGEIRGQLIAGVLPAEPGAAAAPTLSEWALLLLAMSMMALAWWRLRM